MIAWILAVLLAVLPPCPTEDSTGCGWDGRRHGNGTGGSFITVGEVVIYAG